MPLHRNTVCRKTLGAAALIAAVAALGSACAALAADTTPSQSPCFFSTQWQGWSSPDPSTIYLRVNNRDVYRVELAAPAYNLRAPGMHLVNVFRGSSSICSAIDLNNMKISDNHGFSQPLFPKTLTKLTAEEAAAIPKKFQPN